MAMQLKTFTNKIFNPTLNLVRNRSRVTIPSLFWNDPFRHHRNLMAEFLKDPIDFISPMQRYTGYRIPTINNWENAEYVSNTKDGFQVSMNVEHFAPNEINVKIVDNSILVEAKHEERAENGQSYVSRHFTRRYVLPDEFNVNDVVSTLSSDGILEVRVPSKQIDPQNIRNIDIQQTGSPARNGNQNQGEQRKD